MRVCIQGAARAAPQDAISHPEELNMLKKQSDAVVLTLGAGALSDALRRVHIAISKEETRYYLNGVYLHHAGNALRFVATDGHRLAQAEIDAPEGADALKPVILPRAFVLDIIKAAKRTRDAWHNVTLTIDGAALRLTDWNGTMIDATAIDGTFPDYARVVPCGTPAHGTIVFEREAMRRAVAAVTTFATTRAGLRSAAIAMAPFAALPSMAPPSPFPANGTTIAATRITRALRGRV
jgi:DNA polymerase III sliding clamp (beta) subunit (PCNA family)